jgi:hypothetical protein
VSTVIDLGAIRPTAGFMAPVPRLVDDDNRIAAKREADPPGESIVRRAVALVARRVPIS